MPYKNVLILAATQLLRRGKSAFLKKARSSSHIQERFLFDLIQAHKHTEFGQTHNFSDIKTIEDYQRLVPIHTYAQLEPYILRMAKGESNILIKDQPIYFNITSGSTGKRKLIPVSASSRACVRRASSAASGFLADSALRHNRPLGRLFFPASASSLGKTESGVDFAPVSTSDLKLSNPIVSRLFMSSPLEANHVLDLKSRHYICLLFALANPNLRVIAETFPVTTLQRCEFMAEHGESLIQDLKTGKMASWLKIQPTQRETLERKLRCSPQRIDQLEQILGREKRLLPRTVWPELSLIITARGGTSDFYFERFPEYFGDVPVFGGVYSAAEATYGIHRDFNTDGVYLAFTSGFFEFIPESEWESQTPETLLPKDLEVGQRYRILVTNFNGFYRYDIGDVVEVEGFYYETPIFVFRNRYKGFITCVGEKTTEYHVTKAMTLMQKKYGVTFENFCVSLTDHIPPRYIVNVEERPEQLLPNPENWIKTFDQVFGDVHNIYTLKRQGQIKPPILRLIKSGSFKQLQTQFVQKGVSEVQIKLPKITDNRTLFAQFDVLGEYSCEE